MGVKIKLFINGILEILKKKRLKSESMVHGYKLFKFHKMISTSLVQVLVKKELLKNGIFKVHFKMFKIFIMTVIK